MAAIGIRWEDGDAPADREEWESVIKEALGDTGVTGTVVMRHGEGAWEVEAARVGQLPVGAAAMFPDPTDVQPQVERALLAAGKPIRARTLAPSA